jgi:hypothetical protein
MGNQKKKIIWSSSLLLTLSRWSRLHLLSLPTYPHWARVVSYGPFSLYVIHKEGLCPSSGDINRLMMMMTILIIIYPFSYIYPFGITLTNNILLRNLLLCKHKQTLRHHLKIGAKAFTQIMPQKASYESRKASKLNARRE